MDLTLRLGRWHLAINLRYSKHDGWDITRLDDGQVHVTPTRDVVSHYFNGDCACGPTPEHVVREGWMWTHHSLDGRERHE